MIPLYAFRATRPSPTLSRDSPAVIRARVMSVTASTLFCCAITLLVLLRRQAVSSISALHLMGYWPIDLSATSRSLVVTGSLFAGPLYETFVLDGGWEDWVDLTTLATTWSDVVTWRNIVVVSVSGVNPFPPFIYFPA